MKKNRRFGVKIAALAAAILLVAGLGACAKEENASSLSSVSQAERKDVFPEGASIGGKSLSGKTAQEALKIARDAVDAAVKDLEITVKFKDDTVALGAGDFTVKDVLEQTIPKLLEGGKAGKEELPYVVDLSAEGRKKLETAANNCYSQGKNATVAAWTDNGFTFSDEQKGSRVDMVKTLESVEQLLSQKHGGAIQAALSETKPTVTKEYLQKNFKLMSSYSTDSTNTENGNSNMRLALSHINGTVLEPGEIFSYNNAIGNSTDPANGWLPAGGLAGGISVQMYGGGICQASTTIYNAVVQAGMTIVERDCHSMPSSYCPIGLDATVDYGNIDFRFQNPLSTPIYLSSWMDGVTLHVNVYGCFPPEWDRIEVATEQTGSEAALSSVSFVTDITLAQGEYVRKSGGQTGYSAQSSRTYYKGDSVVRTEALPDSYYAPTGVVYAVGEGTDTDKVDTSKQAGSTNAPAPTKAPTKAPSGPNPPDPTDRPEPTDPPEVSNPPESSGPIETLPPDPDSSLPPEQSVPEVSAGEEPMDPPPLPEPEVE